VIGLYKIKLTRLAAHRSNMFCTNSELCMDGWLQAKPWFKLNGLDRSMRDGAKIQNTKLAQAAVSCWPRLQNLLARTDRSEKG